MRRVGWFGSCPIGATNRDRNDLGAARLGCGEGLGEIAILAGADQKARAVGFAGDREGIEIFVWFHK